ncbi:MAG TPA: plastocyanin/azurin family copper-binding protein [Acidimicrobiia bacterium]|nr:plastocyanin/azurin family copper-binding protein [Acidimicrobiia bacterium]
MRRIRAVAVLSTLALALGAGAACKSETPKPSAAAATDTTAAAGPPGPVGPQQYTVVVDGPSTLGAENIVFGTYFPNTLKVRPGDTVTFDNRSSNDVHTVTLGVKADRSDQPPLPSKDGSENPPVFHPCFTADPPKPDMTACPTAAPATFPDYAGKGFWNSGVILPTALPAEAGPKAATLKLAAGLAPGPYSVICLLHPFMGATLDVVASDAERLSPAAVAAAADKQLGDARTAAGAIPVPTHAPEATGATVTASWGDKLIAVNRFEPQTVTIKAGQAVTWHDASPFMPHTVSFSPHFKTPSDTGAFLPVGAKSGSRYAGGESHSGIFGPTPPFPTDTFSLTFTKAGTYPYICLLHPGMAGTVKVE